MEDEKIIDLYWNRDQGAIGHTAETGNFICVFRCDHKKFKSGPIPETAYGKKRKGGSGVYF